MERLHKITSLINSSWQVLCILGAIVYFGVQMVMILPKVDKLEARITALEEKTNELQVINAKLGIVQADVEIIKALLMGRK